jgi:hypothetical protein
MEVMQNISRNSEFSVERGATTLELTIVILSFFYVLLGLVDLVNILRAHSALNEATRLAARQLATTSGGAVQQIVDSRTGRYTWRIFSPGSSSGQIVATNSEATPPLQCQNRVDGSHCEREFDSFDSEEQDTLSREYNPQKAAWYVAKELASAYPRLQYDDCDDQAYCLKVATTLPGVDGAPTDSDILVQATFEVPLLVMMGGASATAAGSASMKLEAAFINRVPVVDLGVVKRQ